MLKREGIGGAQYAPPFSCLCNLCC